MEGIIYMYTSPSNKMYIGQTRNEYSRKSVFKNLNKSYANSYIDAARLKYGPENFKYCVLCRIIAPNLKDLNLWLNTLEVYFISKYNSTKIGYNINKGGDTRTLEEIELQKQKIKDYYKNHDNPFKGKHHSEEVIKRFSELAKNRTGDKNPFYGKKHTEETKLYQSNHMLQRMEDTTKKYGENKDMTLKDYLRQKSSKPVLQIDPNTNEIIAEYPSAREAARAIGKPKIFYGISNVCKGFNSDGSTATKAGGYKWKFKEGSTTSKTLEFSKAYTQVSGNGGPLVTESEDIV